MAERNNLPRFYRQWGKTRKIAWGTQPRRMKAGDNSSAAYGVNRAGQVVGYTQNQSLPNRAFIYNLQCPKRHHNGPQYHHAGRRPNTREPELDSYIRGVDQ